MLRAILLIAMLAAPVAAFPTWSHADSAGQFGGKPLLR
jgi:hypothetical protein